MSSYKFPDERGIGLKHVTYGELFNNICNYIGSSNLASSLKKITACALFTGAIFSAGYYSRDEFRNNSEYSAGNVRVEKREFTDWDGNRYSFPVWSVDGKKSVLTKTNGNGNIEEIATLEKIVDKLIREGFIIKKPTSYGLQVSLSKEKLKVIEEFILKVLNVEL